MTPSSESLIFEPYKFDLSSLKELDKMSEEAFFGQTNPLSSVLDNYNQKLIDMLNDKQSKPSEVRDVILKFGEEIRKVVNAESVYFNLFGSINDVDAYSLSMTAVNSLRKVDPKTKLVSIDEEFLKQLTDMVETKNGYKYKTPKGKKLLIALSLGFYNGSFSAREISAVMAHEIGHCFELCVYDIIDSTMIRWAHTAYQESISLPEQFYSNDYAMYETDTDSDIIRKRSDNSKDNEIDGDVAEEMNDVVVSGASISKQIGEFFNYLVSPLKAVNFSTAIRSISYYAREPLKFRKKMKTSYSKDEIAEAPIMVLINVSKRTKDVYKELTTEMDSHFEKRIKLFYKDRTPKKTSLFTYPMNFIYGVGSYIFGTLLDIFKNMYYVGTFQFLRDRAVSREVYVKKFEQFADIFAATYGYGRELGTVLSKIGPSKLFVRKISGINWLYNIPGINLIQYWNEYMLYYKRRLYNSEHGTVDERINMVYVYLQNELNNSSDSDKSSINETLKDVKTVYDDLVGGKNVRCFAYRIMNKIMIGRKLGKVRGGYDNVDRFKSEVLNEYAKIVKE